MLLSSCSIHKAVALGSIQTCTALHNFTLFTKVSGWGRHSIRLTMLDKCAANTHLSSALECIDKVHTFGAAIAAKTKADNAYSPGMLKPQWIFISFLMCKTTQHLKQAHQQGLQRAHISRALMHTP